MVREEGVMSWKRRRRSQRDSTVCIMVENIMSSMARVIGYDGAMCCKKKAHDDVRIGSTQSSGYHEGLKDIHGQ